MRLLKHASSRFADGIAGGILLASSIAYAVSSAVRTRRNSALPSLNCNPHSTLP